MMCCIPEEEKHKILAHVSPYLPPSLHTFFTSMIFTPPELQLTGGNPSLHRGGKHISSPQAHDFRYGSVTIEEEKHRIELKVRWISKTVEVTQYVHMTEGLPVFRCDCEVTNLSDTWIGLEYLASVTVDSCFDLSQATTSDIMVHYAYNSWCRELVWRSASTQELDLYHMGQASTKRFVRSNSGTWSSKEFLPMGGLEHTVANATVLWQIEHNGSWQWELGDRNQELYLRISGSTEAEHHWWKRLNPKKSFRTVPVAIALAEGSFEDAVRVMTCYRRHRIDASHVSLRPLPIIFNDYLHCLSADPSTAKLLPLIEKAASLGAEYFCIDAGWYARGGWWDTVGEWLPEASRFPNGIREVLDAIRANKMIPGMWLEIESVGIRSPILAQMTDDFFFVRHGKRVIDNGRYQLDFRNEKVREFATSVVDRLVSEYGVGYIKMDYNIDAGLGTEQNADSVGDGLLEHNRCYVSWIQSICQRYPHLMLENCASGGMRMDYAMLSCHHLQSVSDQEDYRYMSRIAALAPTAVIPEQAGVWVYPRAHAEVDEVIVNVVNGMLGRFYLSGGVMSLSEEALSLLKEGIACYQEIRNDLPTALPFWPLGLPKQEDAWYALGMRSAGRSYLTLWRKGEEDVCSLPLSEDVASVRQLYPLSNQTSVIFEREEKRCRVQMTEACSAIVLVLEHQS